MFFFFSSSFLLFKVCIRCGSGKGTVIVFIYLCAFLCIVIIIFICMNTDKNNNNNVWYIGSRANARALLPPANGISSDIPA